MFGLNQPESHIREMVGNNHPLTLCAYAKKCGFCNQHFHQLTPHLEVCFHRTFGDALHFGLVRRKAWLPGAPGAPAVGFPLTKGKNPYVLWLVNLPLVSLNPSQTLLSRGVLRIGRSRKISHACVGIHPWGSLPHPGSM